MIFEATKIYTHPSLREVTMLVISSIILDNGGFKLKVLWINNWYAITYLDRVVVERENKWRLL